MLAPQILKVMKPTPLFVILSAVVVMIGAGDVLLVSSVGAAEAGYYDSIKPIISVHCHRCHDADTCKAGLRLDTLSHEFEGGLITRKASASSSPAA